MIQDDGTVIVFGGFFFFFFFFFFLSGTGAPEMIFGADLFS